jgi:hypothetical protein
VSEVVLSFSDQRGKIKNKKYGPKFKCNTVSVSPSASSVFVSSKEQKKKGGSLEIGL